ncbi:MAG: alpha/beta hydrolase [Gemmatimonadetes bacterium]|nr:alpha/beta hydrolase [Gemmatimonadota bacterium]
MSERPFFFARASTRLFGVLHEPSAPSARTGFVLSHPFAEEKLWSHRVLVSFARALAVRGHPVLRFDYMGAGDSDGTTDQTSLETHLADLETAIAMLVQRMPTVERVGLVGLRLGASIAARIAESAGEPVAEGTALARVRGAPLVLWDPVLDGAAYLQEVLRTNLSAQLATHGKVVETREAMVQRIRDGGTVNVDGYEIGPALFESVSDPGLVGTAAKRHDGPTLVVPVLPPGKPRKPQPALEALAAAYGRGTLLPVEEHQFWREIKQFYGAAPRLQGATLDWLGGLDG